jgi:flagellar protein FlgJ
MTEIGNSPNLIGGGIENYASSLKSASGDANDMKSRLESIGKEFEGVFLSLMLKEMRNTLDEGGFFGEETSDTYGGMFDMFVGQDLAESSPLGISEMLTSGFSNFQASATSSIQNAAKLANVAAAYSDNTTGSASDDVADAAPISLTL